MLRKIRRTIRNIRRCIRWLPVIWSDVWWDYTSLWKIVALKLRVMEEEWPNSSYVGWESDLDDIRVARLCADRLSEDGDALQCGADSEYFGIAVRGEPRCNPALEHLCRLLAKHSRKWWD